MEGKPIEVNTVAEKDCKWSTIRDRLLQYGGRGITPLGEYVYVVFRYRDNFIAITTLLLPVR